MTQQITDFITDILSKPRGNAWFNVPGLNMQVYLRWGGWRLLDTGPTTTVEVGNVTVEEDKRGQGNFTTFLDLLEACARAGRISMYIENLHNPRLFIHLIEKRGYTSTGGVPASVYKRAIQQGDKVCWRSKGCIIRQGTVVNPTYNGSLILIKVKGGPLFAVKPGRVYSGLEELSKAEDFRQEGCLVD